MVIEEGSPNSEHRLTIGLERSAPRTNIRADNWIVPYNCGEVLLEWLNIEEKIEL